MSGEAPYAEVAVDLAVKGVDRVFHYAVPAHLAGLLAVGHRVAVPFGPRTVEGYVVGFADTPGIAAGRVRPIAHLLDEQPILTAEQIELARWMAERYLCHPVQALRCFLPPGVRGGRVAPLRRRLVRLADAGAAAAGVAGLSPRQQAAVRYLIDAGAAGGPAACTRAELAAASGAGVAAVRALVEKGLLEEVVVAVRRDPFAAAAHAAGAPSDAAATPPPPPPTLTAAQARALAAVAAAAEAGEHAVFLLHGVTGSGKTEVYLRAIEATRARGRQAIVLVPEIALTPQLVGVFRGRFGDRVAVLHSALSAGERFDEWHRIRAGAVDVAVGARSAVFAPFPRLGLIVLDEEHENTYKQEDAPRYHARDVAIERGRREGAPVLLGSATPAVESYAAARAGTYRRLRLPGRIDDRPLPTVTVVDMRAELEAGNRSIFSARLAAAVEERLARGEQVILFLNRRGFHTFVLCRDCGYVARCPQCDVSLTLHMGEGQGGGRSPLRCHYCRHEQAPPVFCPNCGGKRIRYFGAGTQQVEDLARERFPGARILRMDVDSTGTRGAHERIYHQFRRGEADILVGTQMVAKGWDVAGVTLVGVISADTSLHLPDFRSAERTFQLLVQVAGRAGRGDVPGEVVVQTYAPDHYAIVAAAAHDNKGFYRQELRARRRLGFPPFGSLVRLVISHPDADAAERSARALGEAARALGAVPWPAAGSAPPAADGRDQAPARPPIELIGPAPAPLARLHGRHRWQLALKGQREGLFDLVRALVPSDQSRDGDAQVAVDPDPVNLL